MKKEVKVFAADALFSIGLGIVISYILAQLVLGTSFIDFAVLGLVIMVVGVYGRSRILEG